MENTTITLSGDSVKIQGKYYTVSNGFLSKQDGTVTIPYKDLLSADYVKRRSKRIMYIVLLLGSLLLLVLSGVRTSIGGRSIRLKSAACRAHTKPRRTSLRKSGIAAVIYTTR